MGDIVFAENSVSLVDDTTAYNDSMSGLQNNPHLKKLYQNHEEFSFLKNSSIEDGVVSELGDMLSGALLIEETQLSLPSFIPPQGTSKPLNVTAQNNLNKSATFPCSGTTQSCTFSANGISATALREQSHMKSENPAGAQTSSPFIPLKLVSAMKGSREKQGIIPKKLTVTWAPDVYDPPVTSASHTVTSYNQQRSRTNKKYGRQKHKGKSSRGSSNSDKKQHRKYVRHSDFRSSSFLVCDKMFFDNVNQATTVELIDLAVNGQDSKCGSSFLRTSQAQLRISMAEAT